MVRTLGKERKQFKILKINKIITFSIFHGGDQKVSGELTGNKSRNISK